MQTYAGLLVLWGLIGLGVALALMPANYLIRRISPPDTPQSLFAAQFSIANIRLLLAYPLAGLLGVAFGIITTFLVLSAATALFTLAAARLWPRPAVAAFLPPSRGVSPMLRPFPAQTRAAAKLPVACRSAEWQS